jgi:hypothetical protein
MNKKKYEILKKRCNIAESDLNTATGRMEAEMQPFFKSEITVLFQPSDGFVVLVLDTDSIGNAPSNLGIDEVFKTISENPKFYL